MATVASASSSSSSNNLLVDSSATSRSISPVLRRINELSGVWEGSSISRSNDPTTWTRTTLVFSSADYGNSRRGLVKGSGISVWRNMEIQFIVYGSFDLNTNQGKLTKQHIGRYNNSIEYYCEFSDLEVHGKYVDRSFTLRKISSFPEFSSSWIDTLDGSWSGSSVSASGETTKWIDLVLKFTVSTSNQLRISGSGISLWRNEEISFDLEGVLVWKTMRISLAKKHKGRYTNAVKYDGIFNAQTKCISGEYPRGNILLKKTSSLPFTVTVPPVLPSTNQGIDRSDVIPRIAVIVKIYSELLSGVWCGESVDMDNNPTSWTDTALKFCLNPFRDDGTIEGKGVSVWRGMNINFVVNGTLKWKSGYMLLTKKHSGQFTNSIEYEGRIKLHDASGNIQQLCFSEMHSNDHCNLADPRDLSKFTVSMEGSYSKGRIHLTKRNDIHVMDNLITTGTADSVVDSYTSYKIFLSGILNSGKVTTKDVESLAKFRAHHGVADEEHIRALASLGWSEEKLNSAVQNISILPTDDTCKICFTNSINSVILPCGHFSVCLECGSCLHRCPFCRKSINKVQQIFRS